MSIFFFHDGSTSYQFLQILKSIHFSEPFCSDTVSMRKGFHRDTNNE